MKTEIILKDKIAGTVTVEELKEILKEVPENYRVIVEEDMTFGIKAILMDKERQSLLLNVVG